MTGDVFSNKRVEESSLHEVGEIDFQSLDKKYSRLLIAEFSIPWAVLLIAILSVFFFTGYIGWLLEKWWILAVYIALFLLFILVTPKVAKSREFALREKDVHFKTGLFWKKVISLPFNRVQHTELESGPIERYFGLSTIKIYTAGGGSADMKIPALAEDRAKKVRAFVIEKSGGEVSVDEGDEW